MFQFCLLYLVVFFVFWLLLMKEIMLFVNHVCICCRGGTGWATLVASPACWRIWTCRATFLLNRSTWVIQKEACRSLRAILCCTSTPWLSHYVKGLVILDRLHENTCSNCCKEVVVSTSTWFRSNYLCNTPALYWSAFLQSMSWR
jgi:hypothetical protein